MRAQHVYDTEPCSFLLALLKFPFCMTTTQLLVAADGLDVLLRARLVEWAVASGGLAALATAGEGGRELEFRAWSDVVGDEELLSRVKWARVTAVRRAVEKLYRCYDLDVSRLLDVCRQARVPPAPKLGPNEHACHSPASRPLQLVSPLPSWLIGAMVTRFRQRSDSAAASCLFEVGVRGLRPFSIPVLYWYPSRSLSSLLPPLSNLTASRPRL